MVELSAADLNRHSKTSSAGLAAFLAHALVAHGCFKHQAGFNAGFDGLKVEHADHEADLVRRCPAGSPPGHEGLLVQVGRATGCPPSSGVGWQGAIQR